MSTAPPVPPGPGVAVTALGLLTLLLGGGYATLGSLLISAGASWAGRADGDPWGPVVTLLGLGPALLIVVGFGFLPLGLLGLLAGAGLLLRRGWGRTLTFLLAALALLLGLVWLTGGNFEATDIALGTAQLAYGVVALVVLIQNGAAFSSPRL